MQLYEIVKIWPLVKEFPQLPQNEKYVIIISQVVIGIKFKYLKIVFNYFQGLLVLQLKYIQQLLLEDIIMKEVIFMMLYKLIEH